MMKSLPLVDPEVLTSPAYPQPGHVLLNELRQRVALASGCDRNYFRLAALLGLTKATIARWCTYAATAAIQAVFGLLERLPEEERLAFIRRHCRALPTLAHSALAHDPSAINLLRHLLRQEKGLTLIAGESPQARFFLLHALGHGYPGEDPDHRSVAGLSCQSPHTFVPVEGLFYLRTGMARENQKRNAQELWARIKATDTTLILLEGIWSCVPELRAGIVELARTRHVIVADDFRGKPNIRAKQLVRRIRVTGKTSGILHLQSR